MDFSMYKPATLFHIQEGSFEIQQPIKDSTVNILELDAEGPGPLSLVMTRDTLGAKQTPESYVKAQVKKFSENFKGFELLEQFDAPSREPAKNLYFRWKADAGNMAQRQAFLFRKKKALVFTATSPGVAMDKQASHAFLQMLDTFQFRD